MIETQVCVHTWSISRKIKKEVSTKFFHPFIMLVLKKVVSVDKILKF